MSSQPDVRRSRSACEATPCTNDSNETWVSLDPAKGKTDFWRKTFYGYINDNGHFLNLAVSGDFTFQARVTGNYSALYDQAGLMVRLDAKHWMKCGSEFFDGKRWASVVFTHDFSDWSTMEDLSQTGAVWWRVARKKMRNELTAPKISFWRTSHTN